MNLPVNPTQLDQLIEYLALLSKWNQAYNLTAIRDEAQMVTRHLLDSLAIASFLTGRRVIDVGTGAGLPGVPMAILFPEREFHLLDSNGKKTRFLFQVKTVLGLDNMSVHHNRVESFRAEVPFDTVLSRAFASLLEMVRCCRHLLTPTGRFLAMKGVRPTAELEILGKDISVVAVHPLNVPGLDEQRHVVELAFQQGTSKPL
ncbi:MAG: 16S rRNA (guanine(527)-N(7))-methyltransferase RsmG [Halioglobus sp.]